MHTFTLGWRHVIKSALTTSLLVIAATTVSAQAHSEFDAGAALSRGSGVSGSLSNRVLDVNWKLKDGKLANLIVTDRLHGNAIHIASPFSMLFADGRILREQDMQFTSAPVISQLPTDLQASRLSDRVGGKELDGVLTDSGGDVQVHWSLILRDGSEYLRQGLTISATRGDLFLRDVRLIDLDLPNARVEGSVTGSPIVSGSFFLGFEHPLSETQVIRGHAIADMARSLPLENGRAITYSSVIGIAPTGQMRRAFLTYLERERAHPYRTFLHYNTWYDIGTFAPYDQKQVLSDVNAIGEELHVKRGVTMDSFLLDDGWDDHSSSWKFNGGFPDGLRPIREATRKYGFDPGIWLSPWGGYQEPKQQRIEDGRKAGLEIINGGFALSGPKYYARFRDVCLDMIRTYGVNQFKFDGTGNVNSVFPGSQFDSDFDAMIHLIEILRKAKPDIYINLTSGTRASPFWLFYADSIWRGGDDTGYAGVGTNRERWITYRDAATYTNVVAKGPLFPLNSLMLTGIVYAHENDWGTDLKADPGNDFPNEVHSYFGTGTQLQEMSLTPSLLSKENWDTLAEGAKWSRANATVLKDTHWVGGNPAWLQVYGWASWTRDKAILVLRNPADKPQSILIDIAKSFELPPGAPYSYLAKSPWKADANAAVRKVSAGVPQKFELAPFQVLTLDMQPQ